MRYHWIALVLFLSPIFSYAIVCAQELPVTDTVWVIPTTLLAPDSFTYVGKAKAGNGFDKAYSTYENTMDVLKDKARASGANVVKLTSIKHHDMLSNKYRIRADLYYCKYLPQFFVEKKRITDSILDMIVPADAPYAVLLAYRPFGAGMLVSYDLYVNKDKVFHIKNNTTQRVKLHTMGKVKVWARTEVKDEVEIDVQPGHVYFLRCDITTGYLVGHPHLELLSVDEGLADYFEVGKVEEVPTDYLGR